MTFLPNVLRYSKEPTDIWPPGMVVKGNAGSV